MMHLWSLKCACMWIPAVDISLLFTYFLLCSSLQLEYMGSQAVDVSLRLLTYVLFCSCLQGEYRELLCHIQNYSKSCGCIGLYICSCPSMYRYDESIILFKSLIQVILQFMGNLILTGYNSPVSGNAIVNLVSKLSPLKR